MIQPTHKRCKSRIQDEEGVVTNYGSINAAKRMSRKIGLGKIENVSKLGNITREVNLYEPVRH